MQLLLKFLNRGRVREKQQHTPLRVASPDAFTAPLVTPGSVVHIQFQP